MSYSEAEKKVQRQWDRRKERMAQGLCIACNELAITKRHCAYHQAQHNVNSLKRNNARKGVYHLMKSKTRTLCGRRLYGGKCSLVSKPKRCCCICKKRGQV